MPPEQSGAGWSKISDIGLYPNTFIRQGRGCCHMPLVINQPSLCGPSTHKKKMRESVLHSDSSNKSQLCTSQYFTVAEKWVEVRFSGHVPPPSCPWQCTLSPREPRLNQQGDWPDPVPHSPLTPCSPGPHTPPAPYTVHPNPEAPPLLVPTVAQLSVTPVQSRTANEGVGEGGRQGPLRTT